MKVKDLMKLLSKVQDKEQDIGLVDMTHNDFDMKFQGNLDIYTLFATEENSLSDIKDKDYKIKKLILDYKEEF